MRRSIVSRTSVTCTALLLACAAATASAHPVAAAPDQLPEAGGTSHAAVESSSAAVQEAAAASGTQASSSSLSRELVEKYSPYVSLAGNQYVFSPTDEMVAAAPEEVEQVRATVEKTNEDIISGVSTGETSDGEPYTVKVDPGEVTEAGSHGGYKQTWYSFEIWLDNWATNRLETLLITGAAASAVAAELTSWTGIGGLSGTAVAAIIGLGAAGVSACNWNDRGIGFHVVPAVPTAWCWPR